jgi:hypothetical protein
MLFMVHGGNLKHPYFPHRTAQSHQVPHLSIQMIRGSSTVVHPEQAHEQRGVVVSLVVSSLASEACPFESAADSHGDGERRI